MRYYQTVIPAIIVTSIVTLQPITAKALSSQEVGKIAEGITVLIDYKDNPDNGSGVIIKKDGNTYQEAIKDYTKAIQINPQFAYAYKNRGINFSDLKDYQAAIKDFTKASELFKKQGNQEEYQRTLEALELIKQKMQ